MRPRFNHLMGKLKDEKMEDVFYAERAGGKKGKSVGCRVVGPMVQMRKAPSPVQFLTVMLPQDCGAMSLLVQFSRPLFFREAIGGAAVS